MSEAWAKTQDLNADAHSCAAWIAQFLAVLGTKIEA